MPRACLVQALALTLVLTGGCASGRIPVRHEPSAISGRVVVFVPGITGSELHDRESGRVQWGNFRSLFLPRDGGYGLAVPIGGAEDRLEAGAPLLRVGTIPALRGDVYLPIVRAYEEAGYERGKNLLRFGYDWRRDSIENARLLARRIDAIPLAAGGTVQKVHLVCQSNATYLCRWAVRFGDVSIDEAERGMRKPAIRARVASVTLLATANGGGIRILREIDRGRRYVKLGGRKFRPEAFFTFESLYQDLPAGRADLFVDAQGAPLDIDLFDANSWKRYGWSIFGRDAARRAARAPEIFGDEATRLAVLQRFLDRAKRMQAVLKSDAAPWPEDTRLVSLQGRSHPTMNRAVVLRNGGGWRTLFLGDRELARHPELDGILSEPGDIHASISSQMTLSSSELRALGDSTHYFEGDHLTIAHQAETLEMLVETTQE